MRALTRLASPLSLLFISLLICFFNIHSANDKYAVFYDEVDAVGEVIHPADLTSLLKYLAAATNDRKTDTHKAVVDKFKLSPDDDKLFVVKYYLHW